MQARCVLSVLRLYSLNKVSSPLLLETHINVQPRKVEQELYFTNDEKRALVARVELEASMIKTLKAEEESPDFLVE